MLIKGTITKGLGGLYTVVTPERETLACTAKGAFRHERIKPLVGDRVTLERDPSIEGSISIKSIETRRNSLIRPPLANIDMLLVTVAASEPRPELYEIDKFTAIAEFNRIEPCIVITKADRDADSAERIAEIYRSCGFDTFITSSESGRGIDELRSYIGESCRDKLTVFAGKSGVGKSTIINHLFPTLELETGELSRKTAHGKHTTRHVELYPLDSLGFHDATGFLADTPGFSLIDFIRFDFFTKEDLPDTFREFKPYIGSCRYTKCTHTREDGCSIIEAVNAGKIPSSRHDSFCGIYNDIKDKKPWDKK